MRGRSLLALFLSLVSINFVSAAFSLSNEFDIIDPSTMVLGILFAFFAWGLNFAISRGPLRNAPGKGPIAVLLALGMVYGIDRWWGGYYDFFNGVAFFIPAEYIEIFWPILLLVLIITSIVMYGFSKTIMIVGILLAAASFFAYDYNQLFAVGAGIFLLGTFLWMIGFLRKKQKEKGIRSPRFGNPAKGAWGAAKNAGAGLGSKIKNVPENWRTRKRRKFENWQKKEAEKGYKRDERRRERQADINLGKAKAEKQNRNARFWRRKRGDEKVEKEYERRKAAKEQQATQAKQQKSNLRQLRMDFRALKKQIIETQRTDPKNPNLEGWIKQLKKMKKQM